MKNYNLFIFLGLIVLVVGIGIFFILKPFRLGNPNQKEAANQTVRIMPSPKNSAMDPTTSFNKTGTLLITTTSAKTESKTWQLLYEEPGSPALKANLVFNADSVCYYDESIKLACSDKTLQSGQNVAVVGEKQADQVTVATLTLVKTLTPEPKPTTKPATSLANPAAVYCVKQGGNSKIITAADGSQSGQCVFGDGRTCDEWQFFRTKVCK
jgi:uncharacterized protein